VLLVRCHPPARVAAPAELGERGVEPLGERRQNDVGVEVGYAYSASWCFHCSRIINGTVSDCKSCAAAVHYAPVRGGTLIREARLRAGLTQTELAERSGRERSNIARWEQGAVSPTIDNLLAVLRACGYDLPLYLVPYDNDQDEQLSANLELAPERRVERLFAKLTEG